MKTKSKMHMKNHPVLFLALGLLGISCLAPTAEAKLKVVTTLPSFADIARSVGGDQVEVISLTKGYQDPHFVDAKPDLMLSLNRADLVIRVGLGLEDGWLPPLVTGSRNAKIQNGSDGNLEASTVIQLQEIPQVVDRVQGDVHPGGNPHFMLDPNSGLSVAQAVADRLAKLDPAQAAGFKQRATEYKASLTKKIEGWKKSLAPLKGRAVVTYHKSWTYFTSFAGLVEAGTVEPKPGIPPSPEHVVRLIGLMKEKKVKLVLIEPYYPKGTAEHVAQETGAKLLVLPTEVEAVKEAKTYADVFDLLVAALTAGAPATGEKK
jgi:zinc/manganese transport system substrate-binding protein